MNDSDNNFKETVGDEQKNQQRRKKLSQQES
jgi:hypothetical protein